MTCFVNFRKDDVTFDEEPSVFKSSPGVARYFCDNCGTPIAYQTEKRPGEVDVYLNVFDEPVTFPPQVHAHYSEHLPWFDTRDELPRKP